MKIIRYFIEAGLTYCLMGICRILPVSAASALGGAAGRTIGPFLGASRKARRNIERALAPSTKGETDKIIRDMWDNLGRTVCEYPHLQTLAKTRTKLAGHEVLESLKSGQTPAILFSAHLGNWEMTHAALGHHGLAADYMIRDPNNPYVAKGLRKLRWKKTDGKSDFLAKSLNGTRKMIQSLKKGRPVGILIDQKYNEGIPLAFFGKPAMTSVAFVELALKYKCPLIPVRIERLDGTDFRITLHDPLPLQDEHGNDREIEDIAIQAHAYLESWIKDRPGQWLWLHRRWPSGQREVQSGNKDVIQDK